MSDPRKSLSRGDDKHENTRPFGASTDDPVPALASRSVYEKSSRRSRSNSVTVQQRHPYATASPYLEQLPPVQASSQNQKSDHRVKSSKKVPAHLKPSSRVSLLKASMSTPDLRSVSRQPTTHVKSKNHWLSAETWCDAFMFPRPRFLLRHLEEGSITPKRRFVNPTENTISEVMEVSAEPEPLRKSQSASELRTSKFPKEATTCVDQNIAPRSPSAARPRSFAFDDLVLPSPMPSLIAYVLSSKEANRPR